MRRRATSLVSVVFGDETDRRAPLLQGERRQLAGGARPEGRIALDYGVAKLPETYLIAPDGTVVYKIISGVTRAGLDRLIAQAAEGRDDRRCTPAGCAAVGAVGRAWLVVLVGRARHRLVAPRLAVARRSGSGRSATTIKCPSCESQSVADSDTPAANAIRDEIRRASTRVRATTRSRDYLVSRYGEGILLEPSSSGIGALVWIIPVVAVVVAVAAIGFRFRGWRSDRTRSAVDAPTTAPSSTPPASGPHRSTGRHDRHRPESPLDPDELAALEEQRDFLLRSLDDLEREHDAGDIDEHDYQTCATTTPPAPPRCSAPSTSVARPSPTPGRRQHRPHRGHRRRRARVRRGRRACSVAHALGGRAAGAERHRRHPSDAEPGRQGVHRSRSGREAIPLPALRCFQKVLKHRSRRTRSRSPTRDGRSTSRS